MTDSDLRWCYLMQAKSRGWLAFDGTVRLHILRDALLTKYGSILESFGKDFCGDLQGVNSGFIGYMLRQSVGHRHPLKHILLLNFLFDDYAEFQRVFRETQSMLMEEGTRACEKRLRDSRQQLIHLISNELSVQQAAMLVDTSTTSAIRFLDKQHVDRKHRPHIIGTDKEIRLCRLLAQGRPRSEIAETVGIRRTFIKDYLSLHPERRKRWEAEKLRRETRTHRQQFLAALRDHPELPIKAIRRLPQNGFQWLYNNDQEWLRSTLPGIFHR
ncbi:MAG: TnsD family Tn7-like transposition protein [Azonexus sp.]|nr:TnsD family Tn7-like transposition protein [Azonexus sp.]